MFKKIFLIMTLLLALTVMADAMPTHVDVNINGYVPKTGVAGILNCIGSDTLGNLMPFWTEEFKKIYPDVVIQIEGGGSAAAIPALISDTTQLGSMSREMSSSEIEQFEKKYGYKPMRISVALDSLAVYVNKNNLINSLALEEVDAIFSSTRKREQPEITTWRQLGLSGKLGAMPISLYGRNSASGTYDFFKEYALLNGDYKNTVKEQPGSALVVESVANDLGGIGYASIAYATSNVRTVPLSIKKGGAAVKANYQNVMNREYPLSRTFYIYVNKKPGKSFPKVVEEFIRFVLSKEGQQIVLRNGFVPLTADLLKKQLNVLQ